MQVGDLVQPSFESIIGATYSSMTDSKAQKEYNAIVNDLGIGIITNSSDYAHRREFLDVYESRAETLILYTVHWSKKGIDPELCTEEDLIVIQSVEESNK
jgi:hypothetical protein